MYISIFRNANSAQKYVSALRWLFAYLNLSHRIPIWDTETIKKQLTGLAKIHPIQHGEKCYISWEMAERLVKLRESRGDHERACIYALASQLMPRVGDELLPLCSDMLSHGGHSSIRYNASTIWFHLKSRKNMPDGATIVRRCICTKSESVLCPLHAVLKFYKRGRHDRKGRLFSVAYPRFLRELKLDLEAMRIPNARKFTTKCFRRGSAMEILKSGGSLATVLKAGQWRSHAFMQYLNESEIDTLTLFQVVDDKEEPDFIPPEDTRPEVQRASLQGLPLPKAPARTTRTARAKPSELTLRTMHEFFQPAA